MPEKMISGREILLFDDRSRRALRGHDGVLRQRGRRRGTREEDMRRGVDVSLGFGFGRLGGLEDRQRRRHHAKTAVRQRRQPKLRKPYSLLPHSHITNITAARPVAALPPSPPPPQYILPPRPPAAARFRNIHLSAQFSPSIRRPTPPPKSLQAANMSWSGTRLYLQGYYSPSELTCFQASRRASTGRRPRL